jgi:uncharacterized protein YcfL
MKMASMLSLALFLLVGSASAGQSKVTPIQKVLTLM